MLNVELLKTKINDRGVTIKYIAQKCNISRETFYNKMNMESEFKASEIDNITKLLRLSKTERDNIFFCP